MTCMETIKGDVKTEITGVLYHEMVHVWQWNGDGRAPSGLISKLLLFIKNSVDFRTQTIVYIFLFLKNVTTQVLLFFN